MKQKLYNKKDFPKSCSYCKYGRVSPDGEHTLCIKKGIVSKIGSCIRYKYDPLKREPQKPLIVESYNPEEFVL